MSDTGQLSEGYACKCGFKTSERREFHTHMLVASRKDGKGHHASLGRVDLKTGEVLLPPSAQRTWEQKMMTRFSVRGEPKAPFGLRATVNETPSDPPKDEKTEKTDKGLSRMTNSPGTAMEIKFIPRVMTASYTPIMRLAQECAVREWGWRPEMPLENFLDTCLYHFFKDREVTLAGYIVERAGRPPRYQISEPSVLIEEQEPKEEQEPNGKEEE